MSIDNQVTWVVTADSNTCRIYNYKKTIKSTRFN